MTNEEKQEIIAEVLQALSTNSKTISNLTPVTQLIESDLFEVAGGSRITFANLVASVLASHAYTAATEDERAQIWTALMANFAATEANETPSGTDPSKINAMQSRIVLLDSMGSTLDGEGYVVQPGDWFYENSGGYQIHLKKQSGADNFKASVGVLYVNKRSGKLYLWDDDSSEMLEFGNAHGGGASTVTAFEGYAVVESVAELPEQGSPVTGYIVGTHIYAYVGENGDTADGKYQDLGDLGVDPDIYQPKLIAGTGIEISSNNQISVDADVRNGAAAGATAVQGISVNNVTQQKDQNGNVNIQSVAGTDGKSAYELAQQQGYQGTLQQWLVSLKGQDGNSGVTSGDGIASINNLNGGTTDSQSTVYVLGANQGKVIRDQIEFVYGQLRLMFAALGNIAFWGDKPSQAVLLPDLEWNNPKHTVTLALTLTNAVVKRNGVVVNNGDTLLIEEGATLTLTVEATSDHVLSSVTSTAGTVSQDLSTVTLEMSGSDVTLDITAVGAAEPSLSIAPSTLNLAAMESQSAIGQLTVEGSDLLGNVTVSASGTGIEVCDTENGTYGSSLTLAPSSGSVNATIYVKFTAGSEGITGSVTASSQNATSAVASVVGTISELPAEYIKVKSINSPGGSRITTDIDLGSGKQLNLYKAELKSMQVAQSQSFPFGASDSTKFGVFSSAAAGALRFPCESGHGNTLSAATGTAVDLPNNKITAGTVEDGIYSYTIGFTAEKKAYITNGVDTYTASTAEGDSSGVRSNKSNPSNLVIFGADAGYCGTGVKFTSLKVWYNNNLVADIIACKRVSDSKYGVYCKVKKQFYTISGVTITGTDYSN